MKYIILALAILLAIPVGMQAQNQYKWTGVAVGMSTDFFDGSIPKNTLHNVRMEFSPIMSITEGTYFLPTVNWMTTNGIVGVGGSVYTKFMTMKWGQLYVGGGLTPLEWTTADGFDKTKSGSYNFDFGCVFPFPGIKQPTHKVLGALAIKYQSRGNFTSNPEVASLSVLTVKVGVLGIL